MIATMGTVCDMLPSRTLAQCRDIHRIIKFNLTFVPISVYAYAVHIQNPRCIYNHSCVSTNMSSAFECACTLALHHSREWLLLLFPYIHFDNISPYTGGLLLWFVISSPFIYHWVTSNSLYSIFFTQLFKPRLTQIKYILKSFTPLQNIMEIIKDMNRATLLDQNQSLQILKALTFDNFDLFAIHISAFIVESTKTSLYPNQ